MFALSNQSPAEPPADWLPGYDSTAQTYELYVPAALKPGQAAGLVLFISPSDRGTGLAAFRAACDELGLVFASPHKAGNNVDTRQRVRIVLDVLDDVRRQLRVDPDRTYIGGFSGGGRIACAVGFSLPVYFGGVIPICAAGDLREESWLRQRVIDRLSVAHLTGETDFNRGEIERFRGAMLASVGVRTKTWVAPQTGHAIPAAPLVGEALRWLEEGLPARQKLAERNPNTRGSADAPPSRENAAKKLLMEAKSRLQDKTQVYVGLMQLKGVLDRWPDLAAAEEAKQLLLAVEQGADRTWEEQDIAEQRKFLIARAGRFPTMPPVPCRSSTWPSAPTWPGPPSRSGSSSSTTARTRPQWPTVRSVCRSWRNWWRRINPARPTTIAAAARSSSRPTRRAWQG